MNLDTTKQILESIIAKIVKIHPSLDIRLRKNVADDVIYTEDTYEFVFGDTSIESLRGEPCCSNFLLDALDDLTDDSIDSSITCMVRNIFSLYDTRDEKVGLYESYVWVTGIKNIADYIFYLSHMVGIAENAMKCVKNRYGY